MHIILGGTGHVGSALAETLLAMGEAVTIVTRNASATAQWQQKGAQAAVVDVHDVDALRRVYRQGKRLFLLNPPADPTTDTDAEERTSMASILAALDGSGLEKIVAESTYGAQPVERSGDLGILYSMEQALEAQSIPVSIIRAAYYMSNWDVSLKTAKKEGVLHTLYPADFKLPMVAPRDIGEFAAHLMTEPVERIGLYCVEGPESYSSADVAEAFSIALGKPVKPVVTPLGQWAQAFKAMGFSDAAADSYIAMTKITLEKLYVPDNPVRGKISLQDYITGMVQQAGK